MLQALGNLLGADLSRLLVGLIVVLAFSQLNALFLVWLERKVAGHIQLRPGPKEVGPFGLLQTIVDGIKLVGKELITPFLADKKLFILAPVLVFMPVLVAFLVLPFGENLIIRDMNVGVLLIFAFSTFSVLAILAGGWASNNKYALLGAVRSVAQNVAYEIPLLLSVMSRRVDGQFLPVLGNRRRPREGLVLLFSAGGGPHLPHLCNGRNQPCAL